MTNPHNVDICVTCVSDKPPQLPLREELQSLGIEVIYNAHGIGAKASKYESKKLIKRFRETEQVRELKNPRFFPSSPQKVKAKQQERKRQENALRVPKALSYQSYKKRLTQDKGEATESSSSVSSWETNSTLESSSVENKQGKNQSKGWGRFRPNLALSPTEEKNLMEPPKTVEFPTHSPEELALNEAFKVFSDAPVNDQHLRVAESREGTLKTSSPSSGYKESIESREPSSGHDPSTLTTITGLHNVPTQVRIVASGLTRNNLPGLTSNSGPSGSASGQWNSRPNLGYVSTQSEPTSNEIDNSTLSTRNLTQHGQVQFHSSSAVQMDLPNLRVEESSSTQGSSSIASMMREEISSTQESATSCSIEDKIGSIKMQLINHSSNSQKTEFYDLTEFSDDEANIVFDSESDSASKDLSTLSSKKETPAKELFRGGVEVYPSPAIQRQLPGLRLHIPEIDDGYGHIVFDLSSVGDEDARLPRVLSPTRKVNDAKEKKLIHSALKRKEQIDRMSDMRMTEERQDDDILESPTYPTSHRANGRREPQEFCNDDIEQMPAYKRNMRSLIDDASSFEGTKSFSQQLSGTESWNNNARHDENENVIHSPRKSYSQDSDVVKSRSQDSGKHHREGPPGSPRHLSLNKSSSSYGGAPLSPALRNSHSRDSEHQQPDLKVAKVSFSQDVEEHYYENDEYRESDSSQDRGDTTEKVLIEDIKARLGYESAKQPRAETEADDGSQNDESEQNITSYEDCFNLTNKGEHIPDIFSDVSADADEAFEALLNATGKYTKDSVFADEAFDLLHSKAKSTSRPVSNVLYEVDDEVELEESLVESPEIRLLDALSYGYPVPEDFEETLRRNPDLAKARLPGSDRYPLHAACARGFPDRFSEDQTCRVEHLVKDVIVYRNLITALVTADSDSDACKCIDEKGDLPVHIVARQLMEWEARWYQKVYEKAREDSDDEVDNGSGITRLYQTMSRCIDILLKPIATDVGLCKQQGSVGKLLPLHIAAIFTVSYDTLRLLLEEYQEAAAEQCDLKDIRTFIPNDSVPLELHDRLSTDFPKWEIENVDSEPEKEIKWTQSTLDKSYGTKGGMRRSDLMFAFYPNVAPYRHDTPRIRRLESRIRHEVAELEDDEDAELSPAVRLLWTWMCTFEAMDDGDDNYVGSVKRIIQSLSYKSVKYLAALRADDGKPVIDTALPQCTKVVRERMDEIAAAEIPIPVALLASGFASKQRSFLLRQWDEDMASQFCLQGRGFVGPLCRSLFNVTECSFPSSFVFLPYKLVKDEEGRLGLESAEAAAVAMKFADCLLQITDPKKIMHFLERKAVRFLGTSLSHDNNKEWVQNENETKEVINRLLSLYEKGPAYLYFLDEYTGVPIVPGRNSLYPLVVNDSVDMVRKVLPLMLTGMILMRGEKAMPVIANVLLNKNVEMVQNHWVETAKDLVGYLFSPQTEWTNTYLQDLLPLRDDLVDFIERGPSEDAPQSGHNGLASEWVVELSLVKMVVEMHDSNHSHAGLRPRRAGLKVLWTRDTDFINPMSRDHLYQVDFKSILDLKESSSEKEEEALEAIQKKGQEHQLDFGVEGRISPESVSDGPSSGYDLLFGELALVAPSMSSDESSEKSTESRQLWSLDQDNEPTFSTPLPVSRKPKYASSSEPISLLSFDDDLDLDDVLQLRIMLDEQEAKLEFLREKISDIEEAEQELLEQEDKIGDMLYEINNQKDNLLNTPSSKGLSKARSLLLRICDLEDRVLCREVEVGQLKNDISCFELEARQKNLDDFVLACV